MLMNASRRVVDVEKIFQDNDMIGSLSSLQQRKGNNSGGQQRPWRDDNNQGFSSDCVSEAETINGGRQPRWRGWCYATNDHSGGDPGVAVAGSDDQGFTFNNAEEFDGGRQSCRRGLKQ